MNKTISKIAAIGLAALITLGSASTAFAATPSYTNSTGSAATDIGILEDEDYQVVGSDTTQDKKSTYTEITYADEEVISQCDVYATIAEGEKVYDPNNEEADEDGFVDGAILVGVPTVLVMSGTTDDNGYYVAEGQGKVKGNIAGTTIINVTPESEVTLSQVGKSDIIATVTQDYTKFVVPTSTVTGDDVNNHVTPSFNDEAVFNVTVKTNQATAGSWSGNFDYTISLSEAA